MRLACAGSADQDDVALLGDEAAAGQVAHESLIDRRVLKGEVVDVLGQRQLGDGELIFDWRACGLGRKLIGRGYDQATGLARRGTRQAEAL